MSNQKNHVIKLSPAPYVDIVYAQRMRTAADREHVQRLYLDVFGEPCSIERYCTWRTNESMLQIGDCWLTRDEQNLFSLKAETGNLALLHGQLVPMQHMMRCVQQAWPILLVGGPGSGKSAMVKMLASLLGRKLNQLLVTAAGRCNRPAWCI